MNYSHYKLYPSLKSYPDLTKGSALILLLLASLSSSGGSLEPSTDVQKSWTTNIYFENDLFSETDQNYTNGIKVSWISPDVSSYINDEHGIFPEWVRKLNEHLSFFHGHKGLQRNVVLSLGQTIYTPLDIDRTDLIKNDRPYAGWLFGGIGYHSKDENQLDSMEINLGVIGPASLAHEAQDFIHDLRGFKKFQGWDNQLSNEIGIAIVYEHKNKHIRETYSGGFGYDAITHFGASLGNVATYFNGGVELRSGWNIPADFGTSAVRPGGDNAAPGSSWDPRLSSKRILGLHVFASLDARWVLRDIFLDGNTFSSSHSVEKKPLVADISAGLSISYSKLKLSYAQIFRTKEFKSQTDSHSYGSLSISLTF